MARDGVECDARAPKRAGALVRNMRAAEVEQLIAVARAARELFEARERDNHRVCGDLSGTDEQVAEILLLSALNDVGYKPRAGR